MKRSEQKMSNDFEAMATALEGSGNYKILRRVRPGNCVQPDDGSPTYRGLIVDLETTGLDPNGSDSLAPDEIIELALVPFDFTSDFKIVRVLPAYQSLREPSKPIPAKIEKLTGITNAMVTGHAIDFDRVAKILEPVDWVIAHNARFDRRFAESLLPVFVKKDWACSLSGVPWADFGFEGARLGHLLNASGLFSAHHRALDDSLALLELLALPLGDTGIPALGYLIEAARKPTIRIWATGAPFDRKDLLKARSYRWNTGDDGRARAWSIDVLEGEETAEIAFLREAIFDANWSPKTTRITALDRFSDRC
jgi:DNA polymerase-3 subunit epsilon